MVASYQAPGESFVAEKPRAWFGRGLASFSTTRSYDPAPDGKRIVTLMPADAQQERQDDLPAQLLRRTSAPGDFEREVTDAWRCIPLPGAIVHPGDKIEV